mgnify:CR=1 FL=1
MTAEEKQLIKDSILETIEELIDELQMLEESAKPISPDSAYGRLSRMDAINNKAIVDSALRDKKTTMERLKLALSRIDSEEYGKCQKCGNDIAVKRLMSLPYAPLCITCASKYGR